MWRLDSGGIDALQGVEGHMYMASEMAGLALNHHGCSPRSFNRVCPEQ